MVKKQVLTGLLVGLIANAIGLFLAATLLGRGDDFTTVVRAAQTEGFLGKLISLGAILNLIVFFVFIKKKHSIRVLLGYQMPFSVILIFCYFWFISQCPFCL